jgi:hypothetical protein
MSKRLTVALAAAMLLHCWPSYAQTNPGLPQSATASAPNGTNGAFAAKQDLNGNSSGQHVTSAAGGGARTTAARAGDVLNLQDFLAARTDGDAAAAMLDAINALPALGGTDALPGTGGGVIFVPDPPPGTTYAWKSCPAWSGRKSIAIVGASRQGAQFTVSKSNCTLLQIAEQSLDATVSLHQLTWRLNQNVTGDTGVQVTFPVDFQPNSTVSRDSRPDQSLDVSDLHFMVAGSGDTTSSWADGLDIYGAWNSMVSRVTVACNYGPIQSGSRGVTFGEVYSLRYQHLELYNCDAGVANTHYSEGLVLDDVVVPVSNDPILVSDTGDDNPGGYILEDMKVLNSELVGYVGTSLSRLFDLDLHDSHIQKVGDASIAAAGAAGATTCPTGLGANTNGGAALYLDGTNLAFVHHAHIDGAYVALPNGTMCQSVADGVRLSSRTVAMRGDDLMFANLGASVNMSQTTSPSNEFLNVRTTTASSVLPAGQPPYIDLNSGPPFNVLTYTDGAPPRSLH